MTGPRTALRRGETGFVAPDGQVWEVPAFPCPVVVVGADYAEIDGERVPLGDDEADPRSAATAVLVAQARRLRRGQGAIRATVRAADSDVVWQAIVTAHGELFDATPAPGVARSGWRRWRVLAGWVPRWWHSRWPPWRWSFAGASPLVTVPGQRAATISGGRLVDRAVPAGAVALGASGDTVVAANSVGQVWRLGAATAETPPSPVTVPTPAGAGPLASITGYAGLGSGTSPVAHPEILVASWYTPDPATQFVGLIDPVTNTAIGTPLRVPSTALASGRWQPSPRNLLATVGTVFVDARDGVARALSTTWSSTSVTDTAAYGTRNSDRYLVSPAGQESPTGSGVIPIGMSGGRAVVTSSVTGTDTVYGLPVAAGPVLPTPSVPVSAPPPQPSAGPVPSPAPSPTTTTTPPPPPPPPPAPAPVAAAAPPPPEPAAPAAPVPGPGPVPR